MELESIQNKILLRKSDKRLFLVFSTESANITNFSGKTKEIVLNCLDLDSCINFKDFIADSMVLSSEEDIEKEFEVLDSSEDVQYYLSAIFSSLVILTRYLEKLKSDFEVCTNALSSFRTAVSDIEKEISVPPDTWMVVSLKDHEGSPVDLDQEEREKIYKVLVKSIQENIDIDTENTKIMQSLQEKIEFEVIKTLPDHYNDTEIKINLELIKKHIKELRDN